MYYHWGRVHLCNLWLYKYPCLSEEARTHCLQTRHRHSLICVIVLNKSHFLVLWLRRQSQHLYHQNTLKMNGKLNHTHCLYFQKIFLQSSKLFPLSKNDGLLYSAKKLMSRWNTNPIFIKILHWANSANKKWRIEQMAIYSSLDFLSYFFTARTVKNCSYI